MHPSDFIRRNVSQTLTRLDFHPEIVTLASSHAVTVYNQRSSLPLGRVYAFCEKSAMKKAQGLAKHRRYSGNLSISKKR